MAACLAGLTGCKRVRQIKAAEVAYVSAPQATLRDRVAVVYNKIATLKNGDRVEVLAKQRRFLQVRLANGQEGWLEQRGLVSQEVFDGFEKLAAGAKNAPVQALGATRLETNLHVEPGRETEHLYQLASGEKLEALRRAFVDKSVPTPMHYPAAGDKLQLPKPQPAKAASKPTAPAAAAIQPPLKPEAPKTATTTAAPPKPALEDWSLVRDPRGRVGWVLTRMVDLNVPLEIAQYAEGQRFVAFFALNRVRDEDKEIPQYLAAMTESKDGAPYDYDQIRVFTWNVRRHRYETAYRERSLQGMLPVTVGQEDFGKDGKLPVFVVRTKDDTGKLFEKKYKLITPIVRRVYAPGEEPSKPSIHAKAKREHARRTPHRSKAKHKKKS